jgi:RNA polymerase sigma factor (sigma-70 family)
MTDSQKLLAEYVQTASENAFRELVTGHINLVYSTALRLVEGDTHRAEDIAQTVFVDLAAKAQTLSPDVGLGGWLHRHTCFVAANTMRGERRRQSRERQAAEMNLLHDNSGADFSLIAPILDQAINELSEEDRTAVLLRFFEQRDFRSVGESLGCNEDAARMRVNRALEKLQSLLKDRGVTTSAAVLAVTLSANAVQVAPLGLAVTISAAAYAGTGIAATATAVTTKALAMTTLQKTLIATALVGSLGVGIYEARQASVLRTQVQTLKQQQVDEAAALAEENQRLTEQLRLATERSRADSSELARLRGQ